MYNIHDDCPSIHCGNCKFFNVNSDSKNIVSPCKRIDHKHIKFAKSFFKSYDCGQFHGCICRDFEPSPTFVHLYTHWLSYDDYFNDTIKSTDTVALVLDGDFSVRYHVRRKDFADNTFLNPDGSLKFVEKQYYKQNHKSPIGYSLIHEYPDGTIIKI